MTRRIPTLDAQSVMQDIPIQSDEAGRQALSQAFSNQGSAFMNLADEAIQEVGNMEKQKSNAMLSSALNDESKNMSDAKAKMILHPQLADQIAANAQQNSDAILQSAQVNREDRQRLQLLSTNDMGELKVESAHQQYDLNKRIGFITFAQNYESLMNRIATEPDPDRMEQLVNIAKESSASAVRNDIITPEHYFVVNKGLTGLVSQRTAIASLPTLVSSNGSSTDSAVPQGQIDAEGFDATQPSTSAAQYHAASYNPLNPNQNVKPTAPMNEGTKALYGIDVDDKSADDVLAKLAQGEKIPLSDWMGIGGKSFSKVYAAAFGTAQADALIDSGAPLPTIQNKFNELNYKTGQLTQQQQGTRNRLNYYLQNIKNGGGRNSLLNTVGGSAIADEQNKDINAIQLNTTLSQQQKTAYINQVENRTGNQLVSLANAQGITNFDPISPTKTLQAQSAFAMADPNFPGQGDPNSLIQVLKSYNSSLRPFVALNMKTAPQKEIAYTAALLMNVPGTAYTQGNLNTWIAANRAGQDFSSLKIEGNKPDNQLRNEINSSISNQLNYLKQLPNSGDRSSALSQSILNYVKQRCMDNSDFTMTNYNDYIKEAEGMLSQAYNIQNGYISQINRSQLDITPTQQALIERYVIDKHYQQFGGGMSSEQYQAVLDHNPIHVVMDSTGQNLLVLDKDNIVHMSIPYSRRIITAAAYMDDDPAAEAKKEAKK